MFIGTKYYSIVTWGRGSRPRLVVMQCIYFVIVKDDPLDNCRKLPTSEQSCTHQFTEYYQYHQECVNQYRF